MEPTKVSRPLPKYRSHVEITLKRVNEAGQTVSYVFEGEIPKEVMDIYQQVVGNALARVTVSADTSAKEYGTGVGSMVSVSLACNQDEVTIDRAIQLAGELARAHAISQRALAEQEQKKLMGGPQQGPNWG